MSRDMASPDQLGHTSLVQTGYVLLWNAKCRRKCDFVAGRHLRCDGFHQLGGRAASPHPLHQQLLHVPSDNLPGRPVQLPIRGRNRCLLHFGEQLSVGGPCPAGNSGDNNGIDHVAFV